MMFSGDYRMWGVHEPANHESWYGQMARPFRLVLKTPPGQSKSNSAK